jgi:hypothetical protein
MEVEKRGRALTTKPTKAHKGVYYKRKKEERINPSGTPVFFGSFFIINSISWQEDSVTNCFLRNKQIQRADVSMTDSLLFCRCRSDFFEGERFFNETTAG